MRSRYHVSPQIRSPYPLTHSLFGRRFSLPGSGVLHVIAGKTSGLLPLVLLTLVAACEPPSAKNQNNALTDPNTEACEHLCIFAPPEDWRAARTENIPLRPPEFDPNVPNLITNWDIPDTFANLGLENTVFFKWNFPKSILSDEVQPFAGLDLVSGEPSHMEIIRVDTQSREEKLIFRHPIIVDADLPGSSPQWNCGPFCRYWYDSEADEDRNYIYKARAVFYHDWEIGGRFISAEEMASNNYKIVLVRPDGESIILQLASPFRLATVGPLDPSREVPSQVWHGLEDQDETPSQPETMINRELFPSTEMAQSIPSVEVEYRLHSPISPQPLLISSVFKNEPTTPGLRKKDANSDHYGSSDTPSPLEIAVLKGLFETFQDEVLQASAVQNNTPDDEPRVVPLPAYFSDVQPLAE